MTFKRFRTGIRFPPPPPISITMEISDTDAAWLAGLLEGEGSFVRSPPSDRRLPRIVVVMTDLDVIERAARLMGVSAVRLKAGDPRWKQPFSACVKGYRASVIMRRLEPMMGQRRRQQIARALDGYVPYVRGHGTQVRMSDEVWAEIIRRSLSEPLLRLAREFKVSTNAIRYRRGKAGITSRGVGRIRVGNGGLDRGGPRSSMGG